MRRFRPGLALLVALAADAIQLAIVPAFGPGFASPANDVLDVVVAVTLTVLLGWHWAFLPTFLVELVPLVDLVPTWTLACWIATRRGRGTPSAPAGGPPAPPRDSPAEPPAGAP